MAIDTKNPLSNLPGTKSFSKDDWIAYAMEKTGMNIESARKLYERKATEENFVQQKKAANESIPSPQDQNTPPGDIGGVLIGGGVGLLLQQKPKYIEDSQLYKDNLKSVKDDWEKKRQATIDDWHQRENITPPPVPRKPDLGDKMWKNFAERKYFHSSKC